MSSNHAGSYGRRGLRHGRGLGMIRLKGGKLRGTNTPEEARWRRRQFARLSVRPLSVFKLSLRAGGSLIYLGTFVKHWSRLRVILMLIFNLVGSSEIQARVPSLPRLSLSSCVLAFATLRCNYYLHSVCLLGNDKKSGHASQGLTVSLGKDSHHARRGHRAVEACSRCRKEVSPLSTSVANRHSVSITENAIM